MFGGVPPEFNQASLVRLEFQPELLQTVLPFPQKTLGVGLMLESRDEVSGGGESHPSALAQPDMNLSTHPAPVVQPGPRSSDQ
jgi:hypothetical protein